jgi:hypothetical protein
LKFCPILLINTTYAERRKRLLYQYYFILDAEKGKTGRYFLFSKTSMEGQTGTEDFPMWILSCPESHRNSLKPRCQDMKNLSGRIWQSLPGVFTDEPGSFHQEASAGHLICSMSFSRNGITT